MRLDCLHWCSQTRRKSNKSNTQKTCIYQPATAGTLPGVRPEPHLAESAESAIIHHAPTGSLLKTDAADSALLRLRNIPGMPFETPVKKPISTQRGALTDHIRAPHVSILSARTVKTTIKGTYTHMKPLYENC